MYSCKMLVNSIMNELKGESPFSLHPPKTAREGGKKMTWLFSGSATIFPSFLPNWHVYTCLGIHASNYLPTLFSVLCDKRIHYPCCQFSLTQNTVAFSSSIYVLFMRVQTSTINLQMNKISTEYLDEDSRTSWL